jgi:hypothetical protein
MRLRQNWEGRGEMKGRRLPENPLRVFCVQNVEKRPFYRGAKFLRNQQVRGSSPRAGSTPKSLKMQGMRDLKPTSPALFPANHNLSKPGKSNQDFSLSRAFCVRNMPRPAPPVNLENGDAGVIIQPFAGAHIINGICFHTSAAPADPCLPHPPRAANLHLGFIAPPRAGRSGPLAALASAIVMCLYINKFPTFSCKPRGHWLSSQTMLGVRLSVTEPGRWVPLAMPPDT